ncbi:MAG TPA: ferredoxin reductase [Kaistia sp.]|nr:ferredoxin reductase [Kaistia sp.]HWK94451.1 ferredoxin reductase [Pseudolabrys sp.]
MQQPVALTSKKFWLAATVREVIDETPRVRSLVLDVPGWPGHRAGQHVDVRLTSDDGYQAQRSYSIASAPAKNTITLTVEMLPDGEVSSYLAGEVRVGDRFELRGPIGGYFVWTPDLEGPLFLVAGGSGVVPLMAILRERALKKAAQPATLLFSSRSYDDIIYRAELEKLAGQAGGPTVVHTLTRGAPAGWTGQTRRIDAAMLGEVGFVPERMPRIFVCGPTPLVESVARTLRDLGHSPKLIKTERFGPTGR